MNLGSDFRHRDHKKVLGWTLGIFGILIILSGSFCAEQYYRFTVSNFEAKDKESHGYFIYPGATKDSVIALLEQDYEIANRLSLDWHSRALLYRFPEPGYYRFPAEMGNRTLIRRLQTGNQTPVRLTFNHYVRTREDLAKVVANHLLLSEEDVLCRLDSNEYMAQYSMNKESSRCLFIPNTYEVYWTITPDQLFERMHKEYQSFWNEQRRHKADSLQLTPVEVAIVASIIEGETRNKAELPIIASLYLNRVHKGMHLQACPTVIYAVGDFKLRRVLNRHLMIDSPYNTYMYVGLPPGPIRCPDPATIDIVLNAPKTDYLFMCANPEFNGTHIFSAKFGQHAQAAAQYRRNMDIRMAEEARQAELARQEAEKAEREAAEKAE